MNAQLAKVINAIRTSEFTRRLVALLHQVTQFDSVVIVGHRPGKHPIYLFDSVSQKRELLFQNYLMQFYQQDPFLIALDQRSEEGVWRFSDVLAVGPQQNDYIENFYRETGWQDEMCLTVCIGPARWVVIYLGMVTSDAQFPSRSYRCLQAHFDVIAALCRQHWESDPLYLAHPPQTHQDAGMLLSRALISFGQGILSTREQQVTALMVRGLSPEEIAECLGITPGTVKNHRKRIYHHFGIGSLRELFALFLNHAITVLPGPP